MAKIEGIRIKNFKTLKDVTLGRTFESFNEEELTPLTVVIGKNGVGKTSLFDVFGFLADVMRFGALDACNARGGFRKLLSLGAETPLEFEVYYRENAAAATLFYSLVITENRVGQIRILNESLIQLNTSRIEKHLLFLMLIGGNGIVWDGDKGLPVNGNEVNWHFIKEFIVAHSQGPIPNDGEFVGFTDEAKTGVSILGEFKQHDRISKFKQFIEGWYSSLFSSDYARIIPMPGPQTRLSRRGENLANVVQYMQKAQPKLYKEILQKMSLVIPGINKVKAIKTVNDELLLEFSDRGLKSPLYVNQISDGTLKMLAYLLMLADPAPPSFICIDEPENGLYHKLLESLIVEFRTHAIGTAKNVGSQVFMTTHQPYLLDALNPDEVWILDKGPDGFATIKRASSISIVNGLSEEGFALGGIWYNDYLEI